MPKLLAPSALRDAFDDDLAAELDRLEDEERILAAAGYHEPSPDVDEAWGFMVRPEWR